MASPTERLSAALADRYRIERELGEGGMATVHLAEDLKHQRQVAIKVLKPELAAVLGAERFIQEITTTAQLQHPHILPLFDSGTADGFLFYVMPYIEGETLRDKLNRETQLGIEEAVKITSEVADALDYAHRHGVIHRDIKPENILLHDGRPMVADFGIALAVSAAAGGRMTETGVSLGTPHYMSPEQATGDKDLTGRSDIYSLASVLYEMLTGDPPHTGKSAQQIIAKVVTQEPAPVTRVRRSVPPNVAAAVAKALEMLPADRFESAQAFVTALNDPHFAVATASGATAGSMTQGRNHRLALVLGVGGVAVAVVAVALWGWLRPPPPLPMTERQIVLGASNNEGNISCCVAIAPDGSAIVYEVLNPATGLKPRLMLKERDRITPTQLGRFGFPPGPSFSPDGESIVFIAEGTLERVARSGGAPVVLSDSSVIYSTAWLGDDTILSISSGLSAILSIPASGGPTRRVFTVDSAAGDALVHLSAVPGADAALATVAGPHPRLMALDLRTRSAHDVLPGAAKGWVVDGQLVYVEGGTLYTVPFDVHRLGVAGTPVAVLDSIGSDIQVGQDGTLIYLKRSGTVEAGGAKLVRVSMDGSVERLDSAQTTVLPPFPHEGLTLSPDGKRVAVGVADSTSQRSDIYVFDLRGGRAPVRLTFQGTTHLYPEWSLDGRRIMYVSSTGESLNRLWAKRADGTGSPTLLASDPRGILGGEWSPDGRWIVYRTNAGKRGAGDIVGVRTYGDTMRVPIATTPAMELAPAISPDGHWLAYSSNVNGRQDVYVRPFPEAHGDIWQVSSGGGIVPQWSHDGRRIFYVDARERMVAADIQSSPTFSVLRRRVLFSLPDGQGAAMANPFYHTYAVTPDDRHFVTLEAASTEPQQITGRVIEIDHWRPGSGVKLGG